MSKSSFYDARYADDALYWGTEPSKMCERLLQFVKPNENNRPSLIDLGCGEGQKLVWFARAGFEAVGVDLSAVGLEKVARLAEREEVAVDTVQADIIEYQFEKEFDVIFSSGSLHYLPPEI